MQIVRIHEIKIRAEEGKGLQREALEALLLKKLERRLRLPGGSIRQIRIAKESLDAREKPDVYRVFSLDVTDSEFAPEELLAEARRSHCKAAVLEETSVAFPEKRIPPEGAKRPVVAGFGPCGIFAALTLAKAGLRPIVLERGACMEERVAAVERFWSEGVLDPRTNVQFGEGGAGSFSDGKLTTGTKDPVHRLLLQCFVDAGADPDILYRQHPHVGTDVLRGVVVNLRKQIEALGGEVRFRTQLTGLTIEDGKLIQKPAKALKQLRGRKLFEARDGSIVSDSMHGLMPQTAIMRLDDPDSESIELNLFARSRKNGFSITYDKFRRRLVVERGDLENQCNEEFGSTRTVTLEDGLKSLEIYVDRSSVEVFVNDGEYVLSSRIFPTAGENLIRMGGKNIDLVIYETVPAVEDSFVL